MKPQWPKEDDEKLDRLISEGHTRHCACRQTWGDGICTCNQSGTSQKELLEKLIEKIREENIMPTSRAIKKCAVWLIFCLSIGWKKEQLDALEKLWWEFHDENGNMIVRERCEAVKIESSKPNP